MDQDPRLRVGVGLDVGEAGEERVRGLRELRRRGELGEQSGGVHVQAELRPGEHGEARVSLNTEIFNRLCTPVQ